MIADKFSLDKYYIRKKFPSKVVVTSEAGELLLFAQKPFAKNKIMVFDSQLSSVPILQIDWKAKRGLMSVNHNYVITDRSHAPFAYIECEKQPVFSINLTVRNSSKNQICFVQPDSINHAYKHIDVIMENKRVGSFYRGKKTALFYIMDLSGDKKRNLDRRIAVSLAIILSGENLALTKSPEVINWNDSIVTGDEVYKIKRR